MRNFLIALLLATPVTALAQTPRDIANLVWPHGAPISRNQAPRVDAVQPGGATAADLARLTWPSGHSPSAANMPQTGAAYASGFSSADLVRLRGTPNGALIAPHQAASYLTVNR